MTPELQRRQLEIEAIELTKEQERYAIWQAKYVEWSRRRNAEYWESMEKKSSRNVVISEEK